ncbi:CBU_0592 family membrane protein [Vibrio sp. SCSIO 43137]|uniref:CBU_0592 family membrane protein n=1 Tax=Vibrio sp. SCSIO 43137 TaxID=3021011 RepID=UPI002307DB6E|nr:hypothetical protein [Vibrio sp. SCSIO 43137]WCE28385.1 hypothetical protein PK654_08310 [Vibrio sp. SCSIO 43137]
MLMTVIGWIGMAQYLVAFVLLSLNIIEKNRLYYLLNASGCLFLVIYSVSINSYQIAVINLVWIVVSVLACYNRVPDLRLFDGRVFAGVVIGLLLGDVIAYYSNAHQLAIDILGWLSVWLYLAAYWLLLNQRMSLDYYRYVNVLAPIAILPILYMDQNWPNFTSNSIWLVVALAGIIKSRIGTPASRQQESVAVE